MRNIYLIMFLILSVILLASCATVPTQQGGLPLQPTATLPAISTSGAAVTQLPGSPIHGVETPMSSSFPPPTNPDVQSFVEKAVNDLAARLSILAAQVNLLQVSEVTWSDSSLGCSLPGNVYLQVLTPGYLIMLEYNQHQYEYHSNKINSVVYCTNPAPPVSNGVDR
jgi:hypothetical protein